MNHRILTLPCACWIVLRPAGRSLRSPTPVAGRNWRLADSLSATEMPTTFPATAPVPGLANLARPAFQDVDAFISRENLANRIRSKLAASEWLTHPLERQGGPGPHYFWYRPDLRAPAASRAGALEDHKAQFGTAVWLNGRPLGEYAGCFTASPLHPQRRHRWDRREHARRPDRGPPGGAARHLSHGSDFEKIKWTPGIYDKRLRALL